MHLQTYSRCLTIKSSTSVFHHSHKMWLSIPPAQLQLPHVTYNHCPCVARQPQSPWPPCVICALWCSWQHHHHTLTLTGNLGKSQAILHMDCVCFLFSCVCGWINGMRQGERSGYGKGTNLNQLGLKKPKHWLNMADRNIVNDGYVACLNALRGWISLQDGRYCA